MEEIKELHEALVGPLVSIIVVTYNSRNFVLETLESAKAQIYDKLEIIIVDDSSEDDTVAICREWLDENGHRFIRAKLLESKSNKGTTANCNRGLRTAQGDWIKFIAGDDVLDDGFVSSAAQLMNMPHVSLIAGAIFKFDNNINEAHFFWPGFEFPRDIAAQRKRQIVYGFLYAPSVFLKRKVVLECGGFDERFRLMEDDPLWFKILNKGIRCEYCHRSIVYYRQHVDSINALKSRKIYYRKPVFLLDSINFGFWILIPHFRKNKMFARFLIMMIVKNLEKFIYSRGSRLDNRLNRFAARLIKYLYRLMFFLPYKEMT